MKQTRISWRRSLAGIILLTLLVSTAGCFRPVVYLKNSPKYPIDVFYFNERPDRPFDPIQELNSTGEVPLNARQTADYRMVQRGNDMQQKETLLARMTLEAKKLGADALIDVQYKYYTSRTDNGYQMSGVAVKYRQEYAVEQ